MVACMYIGMIPIVLGGLTRDYTGTPCVGDVVTLTCTVPVDMSTSFFEWDIPGQALVRIDQSLDVPNQRDQYTITSVVFNSTSSMITSTLMFPAMEGITIGCFPGGKPELREELTILIASEVLYQRLIYNKECHNYTLYI